MSELLQRVDARTRLAGANKLELLLFSLGGCAQNAAEDIFGINVFKVREVMRVPTITRAPDMAPAVEGMASLRGTLIPVVSLARYVKKQDSLPDAIMIVTEFNGSMQGFLASSVQSILRRDWAQMKAPPRMLSQRTGGLITAVTELSDGRLAMMLDVERILADTIGAPTELVYRTIQPLKRPGRTVLFADDSAVARAQIAATLDAMAVRHVEARNGNEAWKALERIAELAAADRQPVADQLHAVLTDLEMPEMDGYMLTRKLKSDVRFAGIPVIMHSSLSGHWNHHLGSSVGADAYVSKFEPARLAEALTRTLSVAAT